MSGMIAAATVSTIAGALISSEATSSAADQQAEAAANAERTQRVQYEQTRSDLAPYREAGTNALNQITALNQPGADYSAFFNSPDYKFAFDEGTRALDRSAASRGRLFSGGQVRGAQQFGQGLASQQFGNYYNRLANMAGSGQNAANTTGSLGANFANQVGQNQLYAGEARAQGAIGQGNAITGGINNALYTFGRFGGGGGYNPNTPSYTPDYFAPGGTIGGSGPVFLG